MLERERISKQQDVEREGTQHSKGMSDSNPMSAIKNFFKKEAKVQPQKRGVPASKEELEEWMAAENFSRLPAPRGQEAFFKFLRQSHYEEHVGIIDVPITAPGMESNAARGYQFWLKTEGMNLKGLFDTYVVEDDTKLDEATEPYERLEEKKEKAGEVDDYIKILKAKIKLSLDDQYILFKNLLKEEAKKFK